MLQIAIKDLKKYFGANLIFEGISMEVMEGEKIGLIGKNGSGKSTLFKVISGIESHDEGQCTRKKDLKTGYQIQDFTPFVHLTAKELIYQAFEDLLQIEKELHLALVAIEDYESPDYEENLARYGQIQERFELAGGYEIEEKIKRVKQGLNIPDEFMDKKIGELSGGEKNRIFLAKALVDEPDLLLLDEPTNHLDLKSITWLEAFIRDYKNSVLLISHDRYFLDNTIKKIYELTDRGIETYMGNYSYYVVEKERRYLKELEEFLAQQKEIKRMEDAIRRFRHWGSIADSESMFKKAENMRRRIERMEKIDRPKKAKNILLEMDSSGRSGKRVISAQGLTKSIPNRVLFEDLEINIYAGERVGLIGENGSGKSTLINMILNEEGGAKLGSGVKVAYLDQNLTYDNYDATLLDTFRRESNVREENLYRELAKFHFYQEDMGKKIESLSGGEKARLKLAIMIHNGFNLLILDEPTNHLDLQFKEIFEETLLEFEGTILFISHDRYFLNRIGTRLLELRDKKLMEYLGNYDYYLEKNQEVEESKIEKKADTRVRENFYEKERGLERVLIF